VGVTLIPFDNTRLNSMIAAGSPPDLVRAGGAAQAPYFASRGLALDLDPYLAKSSVLSPAKLSTVNDVWRWNGTKQGAGSYYGISKDWSQDLMYWYNSEMLAVAGLALPTDDRPLTYDELLEYGKAMTKRKGGKVTQYGLFGTTPSIEMISGMVATADGGLYNDKLTKIDFSSPEAVRALQWFIDVARAKVGYTLVDVNPEGWDWPPFSVKHQAMDSAGYWMTGQIDPKQAVSPVARLAPAPTMGSKRVSPTTSATGYWISSKSPAKDEAFAFLEWYCGGANAKERAKTGWGLPSVTSLTSDLPQSTPLQKAAFATQHNEEKYFSVLSSSPYADTVAIDASIAAIFPKAVAGTVSVGKFADQVTTAVNQLLANGVKLTGKG
jgi:multiple sugar transport system substrate-binding protein